VSLQLGFVAINVVFVLYGASHGWALWRTAINLAAVVICAMNAGRHTVYRELGL